MYSYRLPIPKHFCVVTNGECAYLLIIGLCFFFPKEANFNEPKLKLCTELNLE